MLRPTDQITDSITTQPPKEHKVLKMAIYNENCTLAGREVSESTIERWDEADGEPCDWTTYEGTPEELLAIAAASDKTDGAPGRANLYGMRVAEVLRREVYRFHPELEPVVCTKDDPEWDDDCGCSACVEERLYRKD